MSSLPPEFWGLFGLGSELKQAGQTFGQLKERDRNEALQQLQLQAQLNPNQRQFLLQQAVSQGLLPPGSADVFAPTSGELKEDIITTGLQGGPLDPTGQNIFNQFQGLEAGDTLGGATRRFEAQTRGAELQVGEMEAARTRREQITQAYNSPSFKNLLGIEDRPINEGDVEAFRMLQGITSENLVQALRSAQTETERAQLGLVLAQTRRVEQDIATLKAGGADDATADWLKAVSTKTGLMPSMISAAMNPDSDMSEDVRKTVMERVQEYQESLRAGFQKAIREGKGGQSLQMLETAYGAVKAGIEIVPPDDPFWGETMAAARTEMGLPSLFIPGQDSFWPWKKTPGTIVSGAALEEFNRANQTPFQQVGELLGDNQPGVVPTIDATTADQYATQLIQAHGGVEAALKFVNDNQAIEAGDRNLLRNAITKAGQTETPAATPPAPAAAPTTPAPAAAAPAPRAPSGPPSERTRLYRERLIEQEAAKLVEAQNEVQRQQNLLNDLENRAREATNQNARASYERAATRVERDLAKAQRKLDELRGN